MSRTTSLTDTFYSLTPERVLDSVEVDGRRCTGRFIVLNSYENRVYQLELEDDSYVVGKFYRPGRWSEDAILDEHDFVLDLEEAEIAVAAPLELPGETTLSQTPDGIRFALFPRVGGRAPEEMSDMELREAGRLIARIHSVGRTEDAEHRLRMTPSRWLGHNVRTLIEGGHLPGDVRARYVASAEAIERWAEPLWADVAVQRIHGDCHIGNLLRSPAGLLFLDFDDMVVGPAVQDLWLLAGGRDAWGQRRMELLLEGYNMMARFDRRELKLVEALRAMRMVHFAAWIARRWEDPAFPIAFPAFGTRTWWEAEAAALAEQVGVLG